MAEVIDLTEADDSPTAGPGNKRPRGGEDEEARQSIMAFAKRVKTQQEQRQEPPGSSDAAPEQQCAAGGQSATPEAATADEEEQRQRIMAFARGVIESRGLGSGDAGAGGAPGPAAAAAGPAASDGSGGGGVTNALLAQLHAERLARQQQRQQQGLNAGSSLVQETPHDSGQQQRQRQHGVAAQRASGDAPSTSRQAPSQQQRQQQQQPHAGGPARLSLLSYNLWFAEEVEVEARMQAVGGIIAEQGHPDFLCFQEVTPLIYALLQQSPWWGRYEGTGCPADMPYFTLLMWRTNSVAVTRKASLPFNNSQMGRDLKCVSASVGGLPVVVATSHLESPTGWSQLNSRPRVAQCKQAAALLEQVSKGDDVIFAGDMNWNPDDGQPPLPAQWCDAWLHTAPVSDAGLTYDPQANPMIKNRRGVRRRLDRAFCRLSRWRLAGMELVGREVLPGLRHDGRPVLPSDHFGICLRLQGA